jgi:N-acetylglucosaminyl-diphospho-decaprenol L-rhamnosyltransferase
MPTPGLMCELSDGSCIAVDDGAPSPTEASAGPLPVAVAVVVHYRDAASTLRCLASLRCQPRPPFVVIVDNASPDGSGADLRAALAGATDVELLAAAHNGGFGAGCNLGLECALARWPAPPPLLLLNPDAELGPGALDAMLATLQRQPAATIVGARIVDGDGRPWFENGRVPRWTLSGFHTAAPGVEEHRTEFVTGACMLLRGAAVQRGLRFATQYFLYCEDADLCQRVQATGGELWITQRAVATHRSGGSQPGERVLSELTAERLYWLTRAKMLFARSHLPPLQRATAIAIAVLVKPLGGVCLARSLRFLGPYLRGVWAGLRAPLPKLAPTTERTTVATQSR